MNMDDFGDYYEGNITELKPNEIFVFGSNLSGRHGLGAAFTALRYFGAILGKGYGPMGQSYAIPTKDDALIVLPLDEIKKYVIDFRNYAEANPELQFLVTNIGTGLARYRYSQMCELFKICNLKNVHLSKEWYDTIKEMK